MPSTDRSPAQQLDSFIAKYTPEIAAQAHEVLALMKKRLKGADIIVYDNYNSLAVGFTPGERVSDAIFSVALYPRWITLFFLRGVGLPDPDKLLKGAGRLVRHIRLTEAADLDKPEIKALMATALERARVPLDPKRRGALIIKSIAAKQRPRRP